ncbi:DUF2577 family protein [Paenibacillus sp. 2TAB19]|jgi:hypothetical protein|uniref:DUF2577 family protein n=1 Tax=Paenibacillus sp. 2TAB19 TaxID=3233003 RepID=UPI003F9E3627
MERIEGSGASQLVQLIRAIGHNTDITFELATVTADAPELKIKVDHMNIELEKDDLIVAKSLTKHIRSVTLTSKDKGKISSTSVSMNYNMVLANASVTTFDFNSFGLDTAEFKVETAELEFLDELKKGERVIVTGINQGQTYIILDRAVMY